MNTEEEAKQEIAQEITNEWELSKRPLLISQLGMRLSPNTKVTLTQTGHGLKRFIQDNLEDQVRFIPMKGRGGGVAPRQETEGLDDQELEKSYNQELQSSFDRPDVPKYWGEIWRAFQTELPDDVIRCVVVDASDKPRVFDVAQGVELPDNAKSITRDDLVVTRLGEPRPANTLVHQAIENWCRRESVSPESLRFSRARRPELLEPSGPLQRHSATSRSHQAALASLSQGFDLLSRDELARISIPADLVLALLERSGSR